MLMPRVIPCLDMKAGRVVKGVKFQGLRDMGDPVEHAARYCAAGADELVVLDISATIEDRKTALNTIEAIRRVIRIPLTVGGGVRTRDDARRLLEAGADKVAVNSAAVENPNILGELAGEFGRQCVVLSVDALESKPKQWVVVTRAGTLRHQKMDVTSWVKEGARRGAGEILLTSWDRDGCQSGYDVELIRAVRRVTQVPVIASGGAKTAEHMVEALKGGANAVLAASIFHESQVTVEYVKAQLRNYGVEVRPC